MTRRNIFFRDGTYRPCGGSKKWPLLSCIKIGTYVGASILAMVLTLPAANASNASPYSYATNSEYQTEFGTLLAKGLLIREDFSKNVSPTDAYGLVKMFALKKVDTQKATLPMLRLFFRGAAYQPVFGKNDHYLVFYNPVADVALVTSWKVNGSAAVFKGAQIMPAEDLYLETNPERAPHWMKTEDFLGNMRASMTAMTRLGANATSKFSHRLERIAATAQTETNSMRALERLATVGMGLSDQKLPCGGEIARQKSLADLRNAAVNSNIPDSLLNETIAPSGGITNSGYSFRFFASEGNPGLVIGVVADEKAGCKLIAVTGVQAVDETKQ